MIYIYAPTIDRGLWFARENRMDGRSDVKIGTNSLTILGARYTDFDRVIVLEDISSALFDIIQSNLFQSPGSPEVTYTVGRAK